jgi:hypothetical protein
MVLLCIILFASLKLKLVSPVLGNLHDAIHCKHKNASYSDMLLRAAQRCDRHRASDAH